MKRKPLFIWSLVKQTWTADEVQNPKTAYKYTTKTLNLYSPGEKKLKSNGRESSWHLQPRWIKLWFAFHLRRLHTADIFIARSLTSCYGSLALKLTTSILFGIGLLPAPRSTTPSGGELRPSPITERGGQPQKENPVWKCTFNSWLSPAEPLRPYAS